MNKMWLKIMEWVPVVWGITLVLIITMGGLALCVGLFRTLLIMLGVL